MTMQPRTYALLVLMTLLVSACQAPMQAGSQCVVDTGYLDDKLAYTWRGEAIDLQDETGYVSPIAVKALEQAVQAHLEEKGFAYAGDDAAQGDFEVQLTLRTRRELVAYESSGSTCQDSDCWERVDPGAGTRMDIRTIGFLAADVYSDGNPIWRGWVETALYPKDRDAAAEVIGRAIPKLFEAFPP